MGQPSHAAGMTVTAAVVGCMPFGILPMAKRTRWWMISRSLYTQQRKCGCLPGMISKGISSMVSLLSFPW